jgi:hypothetical protein
MKIHMRLCHRWWQPATADGFGPSDLSTDIGRKGESRSFHIFY